MEMIELLGRHDVPYIEESRDLRREKIVHSSIDTSGKLGSGSVKGVSG